MTKIENTVAVVTGGTRGIGLAIAECLVKQQASVAITFKGDPKAAENAQRHLESFLTDKQQILVLRLEPHHH